MVRGRTGSPDSTWKICFLRNTGTDPLKKQLDTTGPIPSRGRSVRPSVDD